MVHTTNCKLSSNCTIAAAKREAEKAAAAEGK
jgi:hypothetical protein